MGRKCVLGRGAPFKLQWASSVVVNAFVVIRSWCFLWEAGGRGGSRNVTPWVGGLEAKSEQYQ